MEPYSWAPPARGAAAEDADVLVVGGDYGMGGAVAMAAERGAAVIAIVNRRQSDITAKADGVFYTSDGRDIEMAVASTKAFYSQIVAGRILALYFALILKTLSGERIAMELRRLEAACAFRPMDIQIHPCALGE